MKRLIISTTLVFLLLGCSKDLTENKTEDQEKMVLTPEEIASVAYDNPRELNEKEILVVLEDLKIFEDEAVKTKKNSLRFEIKGKSYADNDGNLFKETSAVKTKGNNSDMLPIYDVQVINSGEDIGKAMVSADERLPVVLAYIPHTTESSDSNISIEENPLFQVALNTANTRIKYLEHLRDSLRERTIEKLTKRFGKLPDQNVLSAIGGEVISSQRISLKSSPVDGWGIPTAVISRVGPLTPTRWDQDSPYNLRMPSVPNCTKPHVSAGCLVVAGAQVLAFNAPTMSVRRPDNSLQAINWGLLTATQTISSSDVTKSEMVSNLMYDIFTKTQTEPKCNGSGTEMGKMVTYLKSFLQTVYNETSLDVARVKLSLDQFKLSLGAGSRSTGQPGEKIRHAWVFDGYTIARKSTINPNNGSNDLVNRYDFYLHANLGWGPGTWLGTGWYLVGNDWTVTFEANSIQHYNLDLTSVTHIGPKK